MDRQVGTVKWFATKGESFGFIEYPGGEIYFHYKQIGTSNLRPENFKNGRWFKVLCPGDVVAFDVGAGFGFSTGSQAINVERL
jgi:cold shock CspA family protein